MKKIIYINKEVQIGDMVAYNGVSIEVTDKSIEANPNIFKVVDKLPSYFKCVKELEGYIKGRIYEIDDHPYFEEPIVLASEHGSHYHTHVDVCAYSDSDCFELTTKAEWDKQELLDKAKRDYPAGTMFNSEYGIQKVLDDNPFVGILAETIQVNTDRFPGGATIYTLEDGWAEILPLKFTTEDGVDIYGDMKTYLVHPNDNGNITFCHSLLNGDSERRGSKYFYHKENVLAYIKKHKEKTLEDYESNLFEIMQTNVYSSNNRHYSSVWSWIKDNEPKLYYTKILQLIADDLNDGWVADFSGTKAKWFIKEGNSDWTILHDYGIVPFKTEEIAEKARLILGDKVKYLFNN